MARKLVHLSEWNAARGAPPLELDLSLPLLPYQGWPGSFDTSVSYPLLDGPADGASSARLRPPPPYRALSPPPRTPPRRSTTPSRPPPARSAIDASTPRPLALFLQCFRCTAKDATVHRRQRDELFSRFASGGRGYLSLAEVCAGVKSALVSEHGKEGVPVYQRYYRSYIRAFSDAKDAAPPKYSALEDDYVTKSEFRLLLLYLGVYATLYEVFAHVLDVGVHGTLRGEAVERGAADHRIERQEWVAGVAAVRRAGHSWAPYIRLREARPSDFEDIDRNGGGVVDFREFCEWVEATEKIAGTAIGIELGVNEPIDSPNARDASERVLRKDPDAIIRTAHTEGFLAAGMSAADIMRQWGYQSF